MLSFNVFNWVDSFTDRSTNEWVHPFGIIQGDVHTGKRYTVQTMINQSEDLFGEIHTFSRFDRDIGNSKIRRTEHNHFDSDVLSTIISNQNNSQTPANCLIYISTFINEFTFRRICSRRQQLRNSRITLIISQLAGHLPPCIRQNCDFYILKNLAFVSPLESVYRNFSTVGSFQTFLEVFSRFTNNYGGLVCLMNQIDSSQSFFYTQGKEPVDLSDIHAVIDIRRQESEASEQDIFPQSFAEQTTDVESQQESERVASLFFEQGIFPPSFAEQTTNVESQQCQICISNCRSAALIDCGHTLYCVECLKKCATDANILFCPLCRQTVTRVIRIFF